MIVALLCGGYATGAAFDWGSSRLAQVMGDFGLAAAALAACLSCLWYARTVSGRNRPAWVLFALSSAMVSAGNGVWGWYEVVLRQPVPRASVADLCFLMFAPPAIIGLLVLAKRPVNRTGWVCLALDAWLIGGSLLTITWSLALSRAADFDGRSTARIALALAYPVLDIMLISMVLALHFRRSAANRSAVNTAICALGLTVLCDALFTSPLLREHYHSGQILDAGWFAGSMLLAYAPWVGHRERARAAAENAAGPRPRPQSTTGGSLGALTPYLAAAVCTLGILYDVLGGRRVDRVVIFTGCTVALVLVVRQGLTLLDNIALTQALAHKENHFRSLVQSSSDVIMIAAPTGVLRYVSPAAQGVYGRDPDAMVDTELAAHIHPEDLGRVLHEVRRFLAAPCGDEPATRIECRIRSGDRGWLNVESSVTRYQGGLIFNSRDVTERVRLQAQLQHNASHDPLTDLPNRALFTERVTRALNGRRAEDGGAAVLYIDLDGFKAVNDTVGHQAGDELLIQAARRLQAGVRAGDTAARLGGDEFAALIVGAPTDRRQRERRIREIAERLRLTLSEPYVVTGPTQVRVAASIGVAFAGPASTSAELMREADLAMYRAKSGGKNRVELYAPQLHADAARRAEVTTRVHGALRDGEFTLLHQPVVDLRTGAVEGVHASAHWRSAQGALFTPEEFLRFTDGAAPRSPTRARTPHPAATAAGHPVPGHASAGGHPTAATADRAADGAADRASDRALHHPAAPHPAPGDTGPPYTAAPGVPTPYRGPRDTAGAYAAVPPGTAAPHPDTYPHGAALPHGAAHPHALAPPHAFAPRDPAGGDGAPDRAEVLRWTLEEAVEQAALRFRLGHRIPVTVRVPVRRLMDRDLPPRSVEALLARHELAPGALVLELTDHDPGVPLDELERRLTALRRAGARIALGGFGTGYAAMVALRRLPVDVLALERALTDALPESARLRKITAGLLRIARDLGLLVVADGVDRPEQAAALREIGCTHGRGAVFAGPLEDVRLRGTLAVGGYPVGPRPYLATVPAGAGVLPVRQGGGAGPDPLTGPPPRSHHETPVPPT
ncbi:EAL domain-containing protein [Streptomyces sp. SL13]|uniref:EAL domain-containing protein n=1 Tax=Streptantibioticus silvisoli TaxID=2705255 RepID=A0AA90KF18_9ACTN|nr:EAL domain-containing protein [Streptantibioticus silvisoli]MDI5968414.1 EAL domain-containing protein [Streptantibioticus silvisoli]